jgi:putative transposase
VFEEHKGWYGYRRITYALESLGVHLHSNTVLGLMRKLGLKSVQRVKKFSTFKRGKVSVVANNDLNREFTASRPNEKWVTDVTEFKVGGEKLYFSPIKDLFNGEIVAFTMNTKPVFDMVKSMLKKAICKLGKDDKPMLHSDQGWQYQMQEYRTMLAARDIKQSMSRRGNCHDNASMESFFGVLKSECFYTRKFTSIDELKKELVAYVRYYNYKRISLRLDGQSPVQYRRRAAQAT